MRDNNSIFYSLSKAGGAIGKGLIAGLAGTAAITISQMIEMKITDRGASDATVKVGGKTLGVEPRGKAKLEKEKSTGEKTPSIVEQEVKNNEEKFGQLMHWGYGTGWGVARGVLDLAGLKGFSASAIHFGAIWGTELVMIPSATESEPITKWSPKQITIDILHHSVYAFAAGYVYDAMLGAEKPKTRIERFLHWLS